MPVLAGKTFVLAFALALLLTPAALAFLLIWWRALAALARAGASSGRLAVVRAGLFGALLVFFSRGLVDHFLSGVETSDRFSVLLWLLLAAAAATARVSQSAASPA